MDWAGVVQALGTVVTVLGLVVTAPEAARRVLLAAAYPLRVLIARLTGRVNPATLDAVFATVAGGADAKGGRVTMRTDIAWNVEAATDAERFASLEAMLSQIARDVEAQSAEVEDLRREVRKSHERHRAELATVRQETQAVRHDVETHRNEQENLNSRGLPVAACGALVAGVPGGWLQLPGTDPAVFAPWGWLLMALGLVALVWSVVALAKGDSGRANT